MSYGGFIHLVILLVLPEGERGTSQRIFDPSAELRSPSSIETGHVCAGGLN